MLCCNFTNFLSHHRQAEGNAGKKTIIIDFKSEEGKKISRDLIKRADIVLLNKADQQVVDMALDRESLDQINAKAIHLNVQARKGENLYSESANWPGYDPALQVSTPKTRFSEPQFSEMLHLMNNLQLPFNFHIFLFI